MNKKTNILGDNIGEVILVDSMGSDLTVINAARVSFNKESDWDCKEISCEPDRYEDGTYSRSYSIEYEKTLKEKDQKLLKYLIKNQHWSPFQHSYLTYTIKAPIFVLRQMMRHSSHAFSEVSARYTEVEDQFYIPREYREQAQNNRQASVEGALDNKLLREAFEDSVKRSYNSYKYLLSQGVAREQARCVLPVTQYSTVRDTMSLRSLIHFLHQRLDEHAQYEIRLYAQAIKELAMPLFGYSIGYWEELQKEG